MTTKVEYTIELEEGGGWVGWVTINPDDAEDEIKYLRAVYTHRKWRLIRVVSTSEPVDRVLAGDLKREGK